MQTLNTSVDGDSVSVHVVQTEDDLAAFGRFVEANRRALAFDTETTGLNTYGADRLRVAQFGNRHEAYVLPVERGGQYRAAVRAALLTVDKIIGQNIGFDIQVIDGAGIAGMEHLWPKVLDTRIFAHLVDPRGQEEGGIGHGLEALTGHYIDEVVAENVKGLMAKLAREHKTTKSKIWAAIGIDHPEYNLYAGIDTILAARLLGKLTPRVPQSAKQLVPYEHKIAEVCSYMERTGFLLDVEYTQKLSDQLEEDEANWTAIAASYGCENVNATEQVADVLQARGVTIPNRTPTGRRKVDKALLAELVNQGDPFASAVVEAKKARKWRNTWVRSFLDGKDANDRCHASINPLRARTARMSITGIPAQTLPSGDWMIRRCFIADEGQRIASIDYQAQELRVLAALSGDRTMTRAFREGADLHLMTAQAAWGPSVTKDSKERKYAKTVNFGRVYGGGAKTVSEQTGLPLAKAREVVAAFDKRYPGVSEYSKKLAAQARNRGYITTPTGRRLPVDPERGYAALNYEIQSASRDVTCSALLRLHKAGATPFLRLPIHDEVLASVPAARADDAAEAIAQIMATEMRGVHIGTDAEIGGRSWGSLYGSDE